MQPTEAWFSFVGQDDHKVDTTIIEGLAHAGVRTHAPKLDPPGSPGLVFFETYSRQLCDYLHSASRNGLERILAIATSRAAMIGGCAWDLLQAGASDVLTWDQSRDCSAHVAARLTRWAAVDELVHSNSVRENLIGTSPTWISVLREVIEAARFTDSPVLILGESGTGKELVARLIHNLDARPGKSELDVLDCTTIVPELSGSEFFGHERGAFTGAVAPRDGAFALADGGTLFLDEVGELPLALQAQLLRVVQEHTYKRVGGNAWQRANFRLVCATNRDLLQEVAQSRFRRDLYYRIAGCICHVPPLRDHREDIPELVNHFLCECGSDREPPKLDNLVRDLLLKRDYPGNVRDLRQLIVRISHRHVGTGLITIGDIPEEERPTNESFPSDWRDTHFESAIRQALALRVGLKDISNAATDTAIRIAVEEEQGNLQRAARNLGVTDRALQMRRANRRLES